MAGVKSLLSAAAQDLEQMEQTKTEQADTSKKIKKANKTTPKSESPIAEMKTVSANDEKKRKRGRPANKTKGIENRKQYTLTLKESTYERIMVVAHEEEISFAKFMEKAANEYLKNH